MVQGGGHSLLRNRFCHTLSNVFVMLDHAKSLNSNKLIYSMALSKTADATDGQLCTAWPALLPDHCTMVQVWSDGGYTRLSLSEQHVWMHGGKDE